jgi:hypothetical protein
VIAIVALAAMQFVVPLSPSERAHVMRGQNAVFPVLKELLAAVQSGDEAQFGRHIQPGAMLVDANGKTFALTAATLQTVMKACTFKTMSFNSGPLFDDGVFYWDCPTGLSQLHLKMRDGKVWSASPYRDPATERPAEARN